MANVYRYTDPEHSDYSSVVFIETAIISLNYASLHVLGVMTVNIQDEYLQASISMNYWTLLYPEFG